MKFRVPYLKLRDGRPRWEPGPLVRAAGFKGRDLKDEAGNWLPLDRAIEAAGALNREVAAWRESGEAQPKLPPKRPERTCRELYERWSASPDFKHGLRKSTRDFYRWNAGLFLQEFGDEPVASLSRPILYGYWEKLHRERGHSMANQVIASVRPMLTFAETRLGWIEYNPASKLGLMAIAPRTVMWLPWQVEIFVMIADEIGLPSVGDAVVAGLHTGQRQADVLSLPVHIFADDRIRLSQAKTKALIDAPMTAQMKGRVERILQRRRGQGDVIRVDTLILRESDGQPYTKRYFNDQFNAVKAVAEEIDHSFTGLNYQDLRDTAITRLALAGCTMVEISAISGHSLNTIQQVMRHYLVMQPEMADAAIGKLAAWMEKEGVAL
ncbi:hypothetical protein JDN40_14485 [Rhodomicrobium vannielii ATCC 17100]|uniref:tyrosine-type recombinase/integrase n=1 Tax=Rhodomicrobium vannielii TaxID=1069 RepID=UPI001918A3E9|nr:hypothetical protein [Rhodomicrobium vannielii]MBJ7535316.1 hypothetical protein [Rhodomicrobium vannielii ATCC 17100]